MKKINIKNKKLFVIIGITLLIAVAIFIIVITNTKEEYKIQKDNNQKIEELNKTVFNSSYELYAEIDSKLILNGLFTKIINNNKKEQEHIITIVYENEELILEEDIMSIKDKVSKKDNIYISLEYDSKGYVNRIVIE